MQLHEEIMELMKQRANTNFEYINPHFLADLNELIYNFYDLEDEEVNKWIRNMYER